MTDMLKECFFFYLLQRYYSLYISYLHLTLFYQTSTPTVSVSLCKTVYLLLFTSHSISHPFHRSALCMPELINRAPPKQGSVFCKHPIITEGKTFGFLRGCQSVASVSQNSSVCTEGFTDLGGSSSREPCG